MTLKVIESDDLAPIGRERLEEDEVQRHQPIEDSKAIGGATHVQLDDDNDEGGGDDDDDESNVDALKVLAKDKAGGQRQKKIPIGERMQQYLNGESNSVTFLNICQT